MENVSNASTAEFVDKTRKYARQLVEVSKSTSKLIVRDHLYGLTEKDNVPFLEVFAKYSVYRLEIFNYNEKRSDSANIPLDDLPSIIAHTDLATKCIFNTVNGLDKKTEVEKPVSPKLDIPTNTPAFTFKMKTGKNVTAGKTPAQYLMEAPNKEEAYKILHKQWRKGIWYAGFGVILTVIALFILAGFNNTAFYPSYTDLNSSLTIHNASSSHYTLETMAYVSIITPLVIAYIFYAWRALNKKRINLEEIKEDHHAY